MQTTCRDFLATPAQPRASACRAELVRLPARSLRQQHLQLWVPHQSLHSTHVSRQTGHTQTHEFSGRVEEDSNWGKARKACGRTTTTSEIDAPQRDLLLPLYCLAKRWEWASHSSELPKESLGHLSRTSRNRRATRTEVLRLFALLGWASFVRRTR